MTSKAASLTEALAGVADHSHVALGGFAITRNAIAAVHELIRAGRKGLTLSQCVGGMDTDLLVGAGCVERLIYSGGSLDRFGLLHGVNAALTAGKVAVEEYSSLALALRYHAAALGLPFLASRSMLGSDLLAPLLRTPSVLEGQDPFNGTPVLLLAPLRPDVAIVHADVADEAGNAALNGPSWTIRDTAFAARRVVVLCEEVVAKGSLPPERVILPGAIVTAVAAVARGAHPTAVMGRYDYDRRHLEAYVGMTSSGQMAAYLDRYVTGVRNHREYLDRVARA